MSVTWSGGPSYGIKAFTGREWDPEINLYYYRARYYDPKVGRFISEDPIGLTGGVNFYGYVGGQPTNAVDPFGLEALGEIDSNGDSEARARAQIVDLWDRYSRWAAGNRAKFREAFPFLAEMLDTAERTGGVGIIPACGMARLPARGTPLRAAIEAARQSGIRKAIARELAAIRAGGAGSGVWTEAELTQIRATGKFPSDVRWHHSPTVANRPDLAGNPNIIFPVRGGVPGHLTAHGGNWRN
jgi:RHS repeat-associated protein